MLKFGVYRRKYAKRGMADFVDVLHARGYRQDPKRSTIAGWAAWKRANMDNLNWNNDIIKRKYKKQLNHSNNIIPWMPPRRVVKSMGKDCKYWLGG